MIMNPLYYLKEEEYSENNDLLISLIKRGGKNHERGTEENIKDA